MDSDDPDGRWSLVMAELAQSQGSHDAVESCRAGFFLGLADLDVRFRADPAHAGFGGIGTRQPCFFAHREQNNRELIARLGSLCGRMAKTCQDLPHGLRERIEKSWRELLDDVAPARTFEVIPIGLTDAPATSQKQFD